jgi:hypothetical protein
MWRIWYPLLLFIPFGMGRQSMLSGGGFFPGLLVGLAIAVIIVPLIEAVRFLRKFTRRKRGG